MIPRLRGTWFLCALSLPVAAQNPRALFDPGGADTTTWVPRELYRGRSARRHQRLIERLGNTWAEFQDCIERGLGWLEMRQTAAGCWEIPARDRSSRRGKQAQPRPDVTATAAAVLALLGNGHTPVYGARSEAARRGVRWLVRQQTESGLITRIGEASAERAHAIATCALVEAASMAPCPRLAEHAAAAARHVLQHGEPGDRWAALAWVLARTSPPLAASFGDSRTPRHLIDPDGGGTSILVTFLGCGGVDPQIPQPWIDRARQDLTVDAERRCLASAGFYQMGSKAWRPAERLILPSIEEQHADGDLRGSWSPLDPSGSRVLETAFTLLSLEWLRYYRQVSTR